MGDNQRQSAAILEAQWFVASKPSLTPSQHISFPAHFFLRSETGYFKKHFEFSVYILQSFQSVILLIPQFMEVLVFCMLFLNLRRWHCLQEGRDSPGVSVWSSPVQVAL